MTNMKTNKGFARATWALVVTLILAICLSCISMAAEANTFEQTLAVEQTVEGNANRTKYTYVLTPRSEECPMPEGSKDGKYTFELEGNDTHKMTMTFPADKAVNYQYDLTRVEEVPAGDTVTPATHLFGYLVEQDSKTGDMVIIPYTCYDSKMEIWNKVDENGNPLGMTLYNEITGTKGDKGDQGDKGDKGDQGDNGTDGKNGSNGTNGKNGTDGKNGTNGTNGTSTVRTVTQNIAKAVNTGDPNHILLWAGLIVLSAGALVAILIIRRKHERDEENN